MGPTGKEGPTEWCVIATSLVTLGVSWSLGRVVSRLLELRQGGLISPSLPLHPPLVTQVYPPWFAG